MILRRTVSFFLCSAIRIPRKGDTEVKNGHRSGRRGMIHFSHGIFSNGNRTGNHPGSPKLLELERCIDTGERKTMKKQALFLLLACSMMSSYAFSGYAAEPGTPEGFHHLKPGTVLHVVALKWKDSADDATVEKICQAFAALPEKIPGIVDFVWGANNSPEPHSRGFQHCFIVAFEDAAARDAYLPHPAHQAFVELIGPSLEEALVVDIKTDKEHTYYDGQVKHVVLFKYKDDASDEQVEAVAKAFQGLPMKVPGICDFASGVNSSPENLSKGLDNVFIVTFENAKRRDEYLPHPAHKAFGQVLGPIFNEVFVIDFEIQPGK
jgi:quinol monooxygenase YgiN